MYKVFVNNKLICLEEFNNKDSCISNSYIFNNKSELKKVIENFIYNEDSTLYLKHKSIEKLWQIFKTFFVEINAAGGLVKNSKGEYLFIFRREKWDLPKGKLEKNETIEEAAIREVKEECGLKNLKIIRELSPTFHIYFHGKNKFLKKTYWYEMINNTNETPIPQNSEDITIAKWLDKSEINNVLENTYNSIKEVVKSVFIQQ